MAAALSLQKPSFYQIMQSLPVNDRVNFVDGCFKGKKLSIIIDRNECAFLGCVGFKGFVALSSLKQMLIPEATPCVLGNKLMTFFEKRAAELTLIQRKPKPSFKLPALNAEAEKKMHVAARSIQGKVKLPLLLPITSVPNKDLFIKQFISTYNWYWNDPKTTFKTENNQFVFAIVHGWLVAMEKANVNLQDLGTERVFFAVFQQHPEGRKLDRSIVMRLRYIMTDLERNQNFLSLSMFMLGAIWMGKLEDESEFSLEFISKFVCDLLHSGSLLKPIYRHIPSRIQCLGASESFIQLFNCFTLGKLSESCRNLVYTQVEVAGNACVSEEHDKWRHRFAPKAQTFYMAHFPLLCKINGRICPAPELSKFHLLEGTAWEIITVCTLNLLLDRIEKS